MEGSGCAVCLSPSSTSAPHCFHLDLNCGFPTPGCLVQNQTLVLEPQMGWLRQSTKFFCFWFLSSHTSHVLLVHASLFLVNEDHQDFCCFSINIIFYLFLFHVSTVEYSLRVSDWFIEQKHGQLLIGWVVSRCHFLSLYFNHLWKLQFFLKLLQFTVFLWFFSYHQSLCLGSFALHNPRNHKSCQSHHQNEFCIQMWWRHLVCSCTVRQLSPNVCLWHCCLPRVKDNYDHHFLWRRWVVKYPDLDSYCTICDASWTSSCQERKDQNSELLTCGVELVTWWLLAPTTVLRCWSR